MLQTQNILVLAPHTDDGELGCGASIAKYIAAGKQVTYIAFSSCAHSLPTDLAADTLVKECKAATRILGVVNTVILNFEVRKFDLNRQTILEDLVKINRELGPETVLLPAQYDGHQDHQVIYNEGRRAFKHCNLLGYELPWNNTRFSPSFFETLSEAELGKKLQALKEYHSQAGRKYMDENFIRSLATVRGIQAHSEFAEAFEIYRLVH